jgi:hypothetical protein
MLRTGAGRDLDQLSRSPSVSKIEMSPSEDRLPTLACRSSWIWGTDIRSLNVAVEAIPEIPSWEITSAAIVAESSNC